MVIIQLIDLVIFIKSNIEDYTKAGAFKELARILTKSDREDIHDCTYLAISANPKLQEELTNLRTPSFYCSQDTDIYLSMSILQIMIQ